MLQVARGRYAPDDYRDHIGFEVAKPLLEKAFRETCGLKLDSVLTHYDLAIGSYRRGVSAVIPAKTKVAWQIKKDQIQKDIPGMTRKHFLYHLSRSSYISPGVRLKYGNGNIHGNAVAVVIPRVVSQCSKGECIVIQILRGAD